MVDAPTVSDGGAGGDEDSAIALHLSATASGDTITQYVITGVPAGATLSAGHDDGHGQWTIPAREVGNVTITPPKDFSGAIHLNAVATASDGSHTADSTAHAMTVTVNPVADMPNVDTFEAHGPIGASAPPSMVKTITADQGLVDAFHANDDDMGLAILQFKNATLDDLLGIKINGQPIQLSMHDLKQYCDPRHDGILNVIYDSGAGKGLGLNRIKTGDVIEFTFKDGLPADTGIVARITPSGQEMMNYIGWVKDLPELLHNTPELPVFDHLDPQVGPPHEDGGLDLHLAVSSPDASETLEVVISGLPAGTTLNHGVKQSDGSWRVDAADAGALRATFPDSFHGGVDLQVKAVSHDGTSTTESNPVSRHIEVSSVTDRAEVTAGDISTDEHHGDWQDLPLTVAAHDSTDPVTAVTISGLSSEFELRLAPGATGTAPHKNADGTWTIDPQTASQLQVHTDDHDGASSIYEVKVTTTGPDGTTEEITQSGNVTIHAVIDNQFTLAPSLSPSGADSKVEVNFGQVQTVGELFEYHEVDTDEGGKLLITVPHGMQLIQPGGIVSYANFAALGQPGFDTFEVPISEMNKAVIGWGSVDPTGTEIHISVEQREGSGTSAAITTQEFTFTGATNTNPVAAPQVISGTEDMAHTFGVGDFGFKDGDHGDTLHHVTITGLPDAAEGTLTLDGNAIAAGQAIAATDVDKLVFTPASDFHGDVTFKYTVSDGKSDSAEATGTLAIASANDAAVIGGTDTGSVTEDVDATHGNTSPGLTPVSNGLEVSGQLTITDPEAGEAHFIARDSAEAHGNFILTDDGFWSYTVDNSSPAIQALGAGEHITDAIQVVSADGTTHTIHVTINGTNDVPIVSAATTLSDGTENTDVTIQALDLLTHLLANATDIDHNDVDQLMVVHVRADHGTITNNNDGTFTFHPEPNYSGVVTFSYDVHDAHSGSTSASATMTLAAVNDAPTVTQSPIAATEEIAYTFSATDFGFTDADATDSLDHITLTALPDPAEGTLLLDGHAVTAGQEIAAADIGKLLFTPASDFHGDVGFKYTVSDGTTDSTEANGTIQVANTVDAPTETVQDASGTEDHAIALAIGGTAEAGDTITQYVITGVPDGAHLSAGHNDGHGQWTVAGAAIGGLKITPPPNFSGDLQLHAVATASDGTHTADSTSHALTVHVNPDPDVPNIDSFDVNGSSSLGTAAGPVSMTQVVTVDAAMHAALSQTFSSPRFTTHDSRSVLKLEGATWHDVESMTIDGHPVNVPFVAGALARFDPHCVVIPQTGVFAMFPVFGLGEGKQIEITFKPGTDPGASIVATALPNTDEVIAKWQAGQVSFDHLEVSVPLFTSLQTPGHSPQAIGIHEDGDLDLHFAVSSPDSSESLELMISGLPAGTTLSHGVRQSNGSWLVDSAYLSDLKANLPNGFHGSLDLEVKAISHDGTATAESAPIIRHIEVASVTDQAVLTTGDVIVDEHQTGWHDLPITIAESDSQDPVTAVTITNLASGFELRLAPGTTGSAPHKNADGSWTIDPQTATHLQVHTNDHDGETSLYQVQVTTTGPDGVTAETTHSGHVTLNAVIDNQVTLDSSLSATGTGAVVDVDLSSHGQLRSIGDLFSYHELDSDENTTLYIRVPNSVSIFRAGGMATYGTVDHTHRDSRGVVTDNDPGFTTYVVSAFDMGKALVMSGGAPLSGFEIHVLVDHGEGTGVTGANAFENYNFTGASVDEFNFIPTVTPHVISGSEDTSHTFGVSDFGFADGNQSDTLDHVTITGLPDPAEGTLTLDGNAVAAGQTITAADIGKLVFTPAPNFHGGVNFKYTVSDGKDDSPEATGTIDVTSGNDAAVIGGTDTGSVTEDTALTASGQLTISDADAGEAVFQTQTGASTRYGHFSVDAAGQWIYSLESSNQAVQSLGVNEHLADRISVTSADGTVHVVSVTINGTNDVPTVSASPIGGTEDTDHTFSVSDFGFHDVDTNDTLDHVTFSALPAVTEGELLLNGHSVSKGDEISKAEIEAGNLVFKPAANYNGDVHFKYTVNDGHVDSSEATGVIQVNATSGAVQYDEPDMLNDGDTFDYEVDLVMQDGHDHTGGDHADHLHHVALDDVVLVIPDSQHQAVSPPPVTGAAAYLDALGIVPPPSANKATEHQLPADMDIVMAKAEQLDFDHDGNAHVDLSDALEHQGYEHKQQDHDDTKHHHQVDDLSDIDPNS
ncbi:tandem-95 repeat protein [Vibrio aestuarianus]|uniref:tandem-95 repeat protein n=1 Tax=Vibrio aestuarianus TaxID=28171 RepID=UPI00237D0D0B|nr:tandem-95 repeat protein [Vibrio aestuarianus]MDE1254716.1 tandem-95 repeat protein [Vibrio aestuarianus]